MEIPITHPDYPWFTDLGLKWHALPAVSDWRLWHTKNLSSLAQTGTSCPFHGS